MRVEAFLRESTTRNPNKMALIAGGRRLTYWELDGMTDRFAASLRARGVERGDRVVVYMDNSWETVVAIFAVLKAGAVFSPINPSTKADKLSYVINNCRARALITQERLVPIASAALASAPSVTVSAVAGGKGEVALPGGFRFEEAVAAEAEPPAFVGINLDLAMLVYTSGSTGFPKGVMMTHQNVVAAATSITT